MPRQPKPWFRKQDGWWYTTVNGQQVRLAEGKDNHEAAQREFHKLLGRNVRRGEMDGATVSVLCEAYLEHSHTANVKEAYKYKVNILTQFCKRWGTRRTDQVIPNHVTTWLTKQKHWGETMKSHAIGVVKAAFCWAEREGLLSVNNLKHITVPDRKARIVTIDQDTFDRLIEATDEAFGNYLKALWQSGARPGEVATLTAQNYDPKRRCWILEHHKTEDHVGTKTIWLTDELATLTETLIKKHPDGLLFRNTKGGEWTRSIAFSRIKVLKEKLGIKGRLFTYATRHSFASNAIARGVDSVVLAKLLGHSSTSMIMKHYVHPQDDHMRSCVEKTVSGG